MTTEVLTLMTQDGQRNNTIAAYSLLIGQPIYAIIEQQIAQINKEHEDWDINDVSWAINYADTIYQKINLLIL